MFNFWLWRRQIFVKKSCLRSRASARCGGQNPDHPDILTFWKCQDMAFTNLPMRFRHRLTVKPETAACHQPVGISPCLEKTGHPEPFVNAHRILRACSKSHLSGIPVLKLGQHCKRRIRVKRRNICFTSGCLRSARFATCFLSPWTPFIT